MHCGASSRKNKASERVWDSGAWGTRFRAFQAKGGKKKQQRKIRFANEPGSLGESKADGPPNVDRHLGTEFSLPEWLSIFLGMEHEAVLSMIPPDLLTPAETVC